MKTINQVFGWFISLTLPVILIIASIRILFTPLYPQIEYRLPGFPEDPYGFSLADRLKWSQISIQYITSSKSLEWLANQRLEDGIPLFNERELGHMRDVKTLLNQTLLAWGLLVILFIGLGVYAWLGKWFKVYFLAFWRGGWITIGLIVFIMISVAVGFNQLFNLFHEVFFPGDTWIFPWSDSLIRLFPPRFWQDAFIGVGLLTSLFAVVSAYIGRLLYHKFM